MKIMPSQPSPRSCTDSASAIVSKTIRARLLLRQQLNQILLPSYPSNLFENMNPLVDIIAVSLIYAFFCSALVVAIQTWAS